MNRFCQNEFDLEQEWELDRSCRRVDQLFIMTYYDSSESGLFHHLASVLPHYFLKLFQTKRAVCSMKVSGQRHYASNCCYAESLRTIGSVTVHLCHYSCCSGTGSSGVLHQRKAFSFPVSEFWKTVSGLSTIQAFLFTLPRTPFLR